MVWKTITRKQYLSQGAYYRDFLFPWQSIFFFISVSIPLIWIPYFYFLPRVYDVNMPFILGAIVVLLLCSILFGMDAIKLRKNQIDKSLIKKKE